MAHPTADWHKVGSNFYRRHRIYDAIFDPDLELENHIIAGAPCAGAIALHRDPERFYAYNKAQPSQSTIDIYSCAGKLIRRINWDGGLIRGLGWSLDEALVVVAENGTVRHYSGLQSDFTQFTLGNDAEKHGVRACRFWSDGLVALLHNNQLIAVTNYLEPRPKSLANPPAGDLHSWTVISPSDSLSRSVEVFLAIGNTIYVVDPEEAEDRVLPNGPFKYVVAAPNGFYLALYTEDGKVWIITSDFQKKVGEYDSKIKTLPRDVQWCGDDAVLLAWEDEVQVIGTDGNRQRFFYDEWIHLIPDLDGVRLVSCEVCDFLQKVPDATVEIFRPGSTSPASILFDAAQQLEKGSPKADENVQLIRPNLPEAVTACVEAAGQQYEITWQKQLMKAASFGKAMLDLYSSDAFVDMCQTLRILNSVRHHDVGLPLSYQQYQRLGLEGVVRRLTHRHDYSLATKLLDYASRPTSDVFVHWAIHAVRTSQADEGHIRDYVTQRLKSRRGISFEEIARAAYDEGRSHLATELLHQESRAGKQVPLLLSMSEDKLALDKAIASGDTDLIYFVLLNMKQSLPLGTFFRVAAKHPLATALVEASARQTDEDLLKDLYYRDDRRPDLAEFLFSESLRQSLPQAKMDKLKLALSSLSDSAKDPRLASSLKIVQEAQQLIRVQASLDREIQDASQTQYMGQSLNQTVFHLIVHSQLKKAQKLAQDFHMSPQTYEWIRLRALVTSRNWRELEDLGQKTKKSAIGWESYFDEILLAGNTKLAGSIFVSKCSTLSARERSEMYMKCGMSQNAGEELAKVKDLEGLEDLKTRLGSSGHNDIERTIANLRSRR